MRLSRVYLREKWTFPFRNLINDQIRFYFVFKCFVSELEIAMKKSQIWTKRKMKLIDFSPLLLCGKPKLGRSNLTRTSMQLICNITHFDEIF